MDSTENWTFGLMGEILDLMKSCSPNNCLQAITRQKMQRKKDQSSDLMSASLQLPYLHYV
jgi:hypothetical protein